jgi:hypothetical protein
MNAIEIIEQVRAHDADLVVDNDRLIVRGRAGPLPHDLQRAISEHKAEVLIALGTPIDRTVATILEDIRPHLPPALRRLPDGNLLALVNWSIISAWGTATRQLERKGPP